jgi:hypothetical protein
VGYLIGHARCEEKIKESTRREALRVAVTNTTKPVLLEDLWDEY